MLNCKEEQKFEVMTSFLSPGMMLRGPAYTYQGEKVVEACTPITKEQVKYLKEKNIKSIYYTSTQYKMKESVANPVLDDQTLDTALTILEHIENKIHEEGEKCHFDKNDVGDVVQSFIKNIKSRPDACLNLLDLVQYDDYTYTHSINVATLSIMMGISLGLDDNKVQTLGISGLLHDIGKTQIDPVIINKPSKLSSDEWKLIKQHPILGYKIIQNQENFFEGVDKVVLCHHESYDGLGYPLGLAHEKFSILSQVVSISDVFDSLTSKRTYKPAWSYSEAYAFFMDGSGKKFDPRLSQVFLRDMSKKLHESSVYPINSLVELNTGEVGKVIDHRQYMHTLRPVIEIFLGRDSLPMTRQLQIDLEKDPARFIVRRIMDESRLTILNKYCTIDSNK